MVKEYPMNYLSCLCVPERGGHNFVISQDQEGKEDMLPVLWFDCDRRFFIGNAKGVEPAEPIYRERWRQVDKTPNADAEKVAIHVPQPKIVKLYYDVCASIDRHNQKRQHDLELKRYVHSHHWWKQVGITILGIIFVDTINVRQSLVHKNEIDTDPNHFLTELAHELIDNDRSMHASSSRKRRR